MESKASLQLLCFTRFPSHQAVPPDLRSDTGAHVRSRLSPICRTPIRSADDVRAAAIADPAFGRVFTDHMVSIRYSDGQRAGTTRR
jgi:hypothetical protein